MQTMFLNAFEIFCVAPAGPFTADTPTHLIHCHLIFVAQFLCIRQFKSGSHGRDSTAQHGYLGFLRGFRHSKNLLGDL